MNNEYVVINETAILKRMEGLEKDINNALTNEQKMLWTHELNVLRILLSQSTPLIPDIKDIQIWLSKQSYQKEYGEQEYMMYYDVDIPKIIQDYITNLKLDI